MFNRFNELQTPASSLAIDVLCFLAITNSGGGAISLILNKSAVLYLPYFQSFAQVPYSQA